MFNYYKNEISSLERTVELEIFDRNIKSNYFLSKDIIRIMKFSGIKDEKEIERLVNIYKHIADTLNTAKKTVLINANKVEYKYYQQPEG